MECKENIIKYLLSSEFVECPVLDKRQREVVLMKLKEGLSFRNIGMKIQTSGQFVERLFCKSINILECYLIPKAPDTLIKNSLLSKRIKNSLKYDRKIQCLADFNNLPVEYLLSKACLGKGSINEIQEYIKDLGFSLKFKEKVKRSYSSKFDKKQFSEFSNEEILQLMADISRCLKDRLKSINEIKNSPQQLQDS